MLESLSELVYCLEMAMINSKRLKELIRARGEYGLPSLAAESRISVSTLEKMMSGTYPAFPKLALRERLSAALNVPMEDLFPSTRNVRKKAG